MSEYELITGIFLFSIIIVPYFLRNKETVSLPNIAVTVGILGTFVGIFIFFPLLSKVTETKKGFTDQSHFIHLG